MAWSLDARIPVSFASDGAVPQGAAWLLEGAAPVPEGVVGANFSPDATPHARGCSCCAARNATALALAGLFLTRARGEAGLFGSVVALTTSAAGRAAVVDALHADPLVSARFRLAGPA